MKLLDYSQTLTITTNGDGGEDTYTIRAVPSPDDLRAYNAYAVRAAFVLASNKALTDRIAEHGPVPAADVQAVVNEANEVGKLQDAILLRFLTGWSHDAEITPDNVDRIHPRDKSAIMDGVRDIAKAMQGVQGDPKG